MSMSTEPPEDEQGRESSIARAMAATGHSREEVLSEDAPGVGLPTGYTVKSIDQFPLGPTQVYRAVVQVPGTLTNREIWMCANGSGGYNITVALL